MTAAKSVIVLVNYEDGTSVTASIVPREDEGPLLVDIEKIEEVEEIVTGHLNRRFLERPVVVRRRLDILSAGTMRLFYGPPLNPKEPDEEVSPR